MNFTKRTMPLIIIFQFVCIMSYDNDLIGLEEHEIFSRYKVTEYGSIHVSFPIIMIIAKATYLRVTSVVDAMKLVFFGLK